MAKRGDLRTGFAQCLRGRRGAAARFGLGVIWRACEPGSLFAADANSTRQRVDAPGSVAVSDGRTWAYGRTRGRGDESPRNRPYAVCLHAGAEAGGVGRRQRQAALAVRRRASWTA